MDTVDDVLSRMTLDEKIGQCLTHSWRGSVITPCLVETLEELHAGGLRIEPYTTEATSSKAYGHDIDTGEWEPPEGYFEVTETYWRIKHPGFEIPASEYARRLNKVKEIAMNRPSGVPLHVTTDYEGDFSHDFPFDGINMFPPPMGLRAAGGPELSYKVANALGRQLAALGVNMMHSPVCDVNINPGNPEINIRAFTDDPDVFAEYALQYMKGLEDAGIIATAKHFPGRGDSAVDAHDDLPVIEAERDRLDTVELAPYRRLIAEGLRGVMVAHNAYPALDPELVPATVSRDIITALLREELGFDGVITTDAMGMGAIVRRWGVPVASAMAFKAGVDLILLKFDNELRSQVFFELKRWVDEGRITEDELDESVRRILTMKMEQGLFEDGGKVEAEEATPTLRDEGIVDLSRQVARDAIMVLRDREGLLPISDDQKVMIIEQMIIPEFVPENVHYHAHSFGEAMLDHSLNAVPVDCDFEASEEDQKTVMSLLDEVDVVVMTNWFWRVLGTSNEALVRAVVQSGTPVVVVTNNPYPMGATAEAGTVICTYSVTPESLKAAADLVYGEQEPRGDWPLVNYELPE
jgi:beta-N-acetylhexosaminidase